MTKSGTEWQVNRLAPGVSPTLVSVVDSQLPVGAAKIQCIDKITGNAVVLPDLPREGSYIVPPGGCTIANVGLPMAGSTEVNVIPSSTLYTTLPWVLENTRKDLYYMYDTLTISGGSLTPTQSGILTAEIEVTIPPREGGTGTLTVTGGLEANALCPG
jgi:hypothetical protein